MNSNLLTQDVGVALRDLPAMETFVHDVLRESSCKHDLVTWWQDSPQFRKATALHVLNDHAEDFIIGGPRAWLRVLDTDKMGEFAQYADQVHVIRILQGKDADDDDGIYLYRRGK